MSPRSRSLLPLAAGGLAIAAFLALVARFHHPAHGLTVFYQLDADNAAHAITALRAQPVHIHPAPGGYDGLYYAQLAFDPSLRNPELPRAMDSLPYRARRILAPALAWLAGLGRPGWIIHTYAWLNVAAWLALAAILWRLLGVADTRGWLAWAGLLFSAGALSSVRLALTDLPALAVLAGALLLIERGRPRAGAITIGLAALARETSLLAGAGAAEAPWFSRRNFLRAAMAAAPLAVWLAYVQWIAGPAGQGWGNLAWPLAGLGEKITASLRSLADVADKPLAWTTLAATLALVAQAVFFAVHRQPADRWWRIGAAYAALLILLGTPVWEGFPGAATRVLLPLNLAFNVAVLRARAPLAWLVAGNLTVLSGLLALRDVPNDPREIAAATFGGTAAVARAGDGWWGREQTSRHIWLWARDRGTLEIRRWSHGGAPVRLEFALRAMTPRSVVVRHRGREIWRAEPGTGFSQHTLDLPGSADPVITLEFASDAAPVPENAAPGARELGFALYDLRLTAAPP
ncbi:MAG: hypothetical protein JNL39_12540 [Opitutaceae bacterium]|nr:hypothetical protein [Opitutaceae bacterium]